jgi:hypothetical protein
MVQSGVNIRQLSNNQWSALFGVVVGYISLTQILKNPSSIPGIVIFLSFYILELESSWPLPVASSLPLRPGRGTILIHTVLDLSSEARLSSVPLLVLKVEEKRSMSSIFSLSIYAKFWMETRPWAPPPPPPSSAYRKIQKLHSTKKNKN